MRNTPTKLRQAGLTLIEVVVSLAIMGMASIGVVQLTDRYSTDVKNSVTSDQLKRAGDAARSYIKDNYTAITAVATAGSPYLITNSMLVSGGYLPPGTPSTNGYNQNLCTLVLQPSANNLQALVATEGGTALDDITLGAVAALAGGSAGAVRTATPNQILGTMGGWSIPVASYDNLTNNAGQRCDGTAGKVQLTAGHPAMALWFENGNYQSATLYRDPVPGHPELNTMNTPIILNAPQTIGAACTVTGGLANDSTGAVVNCNGGTWKSVGGSAYWADPVANIASLPACNVASTGATRVVKTPTVGTGPRAFTCNGASWIALAVDDNGNIAIAGKVVGSGSNASYGAITIEGEKTGWAGINFRRPGGVNAGTLMMHPSYSGFYNAADNGWRSYVDDAGNTTLGNQAGPAYAVQNGTLNPGWGVETWPCTTGTISKAAYTIADGWAYNGKTLSCISGVWSAPGGGGLGIGQSWTNPARSVNVTYQNTTSKPIMVSISPSSNDYNYMYIYVDGVMTAYAYNDRYAGLRSASTIVPPGSTYYAASAYSHALWAELR